MRNIRKIILLTVFTLLSMFQVVCNAGTMDTLKKVTYYCPCPKCNGIYGFETSTGVMLNKKNSFTVVAADPTVYPYGTIIYTKERRANGEIVGGYWFVCDCGSGVKGKHIDVFMMLDDRSLVEGKRVEGKVIKWEIVNQKGGENLNLGKDSIARMNWTMKDYETYVNRYNSIVIRQYVEGKPNAPKEVVLKLVNVPVEPDFDVLVTDTEGNTNWKSAAERPSGTVVDIWEPGISKIVLTDRSNIKGRVAAWEIINVRTGEPEWLGNGEMATIEWIDEAYAMYINNDGLITIRMKSLGGTSGETKTKTIYLNPVVLGVRVYTDGDIVNYNMLNGTENIIYAGFDSKITLAGKEVIKYNLVNEETQEKIEIENGVIEKLEEFRSNLKEIKDGLYKTTIELVRENDTKEEYEIIIDLTGKEIELRLGAEDKVYKGSKEDPLVEGAYLGAIHLISKGTGKVAKWEMYNAVTGEYEKHYDDELKNDIILYPGIRNYIELGNDEYCMKVKATYEDGHEEIREIYHQMVRIESPNENAVVKVEEPLKIKWNGKAGEKYFIRMVKLSPKGDEYNTDIIEGEIVEGNEYPVNRELYLEADSDYRIAVRGVDGILYDVIVVTTKGISEGSISNIAEIKEVEAGQEVKIKLTGRKEGEKYLVGVYSKGEEILAPKPTEEDEIVIIPAEKSKEGLYQIRINVIRGDIISAGTTYTIKISK